MRTPLFNIRLESSLLEALAKVAEQQGLPKAEVIRQYTVAGLEKALNTKIEQKQRKREIKNKVTA